MSNPQEDLPSAESTFSPSFEELITHIRNGTLSELTGGGLIQAIAVNSKPRLDASIHEGPDGAPISSFGRKFEDGFEGWKPGEVVNAQFVVSQREGKPALLVSDRYIGDIRHADTFILDEMSDEDGQELQKMGMALLDVDVEVTSERQYRVSDMFDYSARIRRINAVQEAWDGEGEPNVGEPVLLQGQVVEYTPGEADYENALFPVTKIQLPNGRIVEVEMTNGEINYESGVLDFFYPRDFQVGDEVQLNTKFSNSSTWPQHKDKAPTFHAAFCRSAFLANPDPERKAVYDAHRKDIGRRTKELRDLDGQPFRDAYADLMNTYNENPGAKIPRSLMTPTEWDRVKQLAQETFADRPDEMPVLNFGSYSAMTEIKRGYGVDAFRMSRKEFLAFGMAVAEGDIVADPAKESSVDSPWEVMSDEYSDEEQTAILKRAIIHGLEKCAGKIVVHRKDVLVDPGTQINFDDKYLLEQAMIYLSSIDSIENAEFLYDTTKKRLEDLLVGTTRPDRAYDPTGKLIQSLDLLLRSAGVWDMDHDWTAVKDFAKLDYFVGKVPELQEMASDLAASGESSKVFTAGYLVGLLEMIAKLSKLPPHTQN